MGVKRKKHTCKLFVGVEIIKTLRGQLVVVVGRIVRWPPRLPTASVHTPSLRYSNTNLNVAMKELYRNKVLNQLTFL